MQRSSTELEMGNSYHVEQRERRDSNASSSVDFEPERGRESGLQGTVLHEEVEEAHTKVYR